MSETNKRIDGAPYMGRHEYRIAHDELSYLFDDATLGIERILSYKTSPLLHRSFSYDTDGAYAVAETEHLSEEGNSLSATPVREYLKITQVEFKPPHSYKAVYNVRAIHAIDCDDSPVIVTDYCIEKLCNNRYFGTMRRYAFANNGDDFAGISHEFGELENMTVFDINELVTTLDKHCNEIDYEAAHAQVINERF